MDLEPDHSPDPVEVAPLRPTLTELFRRLLADTEAYIRAEATLYRAQAGRKILSAGVVAALLGAAILLAQAATVALLIGILLSLAPYIGIGWATAGVVLVSFAVVGVLMKIAVVRIDGLIAPKDNDE